MSKLISKRNHFGTSLKTVRKRRGLSQEAFSVLSSRTYVSTLERGQKSPTLSKVEELAEVLGVHALSLLALAYIRAKSPNDVDIALDHINDEIKSLFTAL